jgi:hypothetical protein
MVGFIEGVYLGVVVVKKKVRRDFETRFKPKPGSLASKPISVYLPKELDEFVRSLPNRSHWLRQVIAEAAEREQQKQPGNDKD